MSSQEQPCSSPNPSNFASRPHPSLRQGYPPACRWVPPVCSKFLVFEALALLAWLSKLQVLKSHSNPSLESSVFRPVNNHKCLASEDVSTNTSALGLNSLLWRAQHASVAGLQLRLLKERCSTLCLPDSNIVPATLQRQRPRSASQGKVDARNA